MLFRPSRRRRGPDPNLPIRMLLLALGAVAGLAGMAFDLMWLVTAGTIILAIGLGIALWNQRRSADTDASPPDDV